MTDARPWDRRDAESEEAWEGFQTYRDMGTSRSIAKVAKTIGKSEGLMQGWSRRHDWPNRAKAYDRHLDRQMQEVWLDKMGAMVEETNALGRELVRRAAIRLAHIPEEKAIPYAILRAAEIAAKIQREGMGSIKPDKPIDDTSDGIKVDIIALMEEIMRRDRTPGS